MGEKPIRAANKHNRSIVQEKGESAFNDDPKIGEKTESCSIIEIIMDRRKLCP